MFIHFLNKSNSLRGSQESDKKLLETLKVAPISRIEGNFSARAEKQLRFFRAEGIIRNMNNVIAALDEYVCAHYSDYVRIAALEGYEMPEVLYVAEDGNLARRDSSCMRLCHQAKRDVLLARLKEGLSDTDFTFSFRFIPLRDRLPERFRKNTFAHLLPGVLHRCNETAESAGEKLDIEPRFWNKIVKGRLWPEKNTVLALALVCGMSGSDLNLLFAVCGFSFSDENVRDVVVRYLLEQKVFGAEARDACLNEYGISCLPIKRETR